MKAFLDAILALWRAFWGLKVPDSIPAPVPPPVKEPEPPAPMPEPTPPPRKTRQERLYEVAKASIGKDMSPLDKAPDSLACMESVDGVWLVAFGEHLLEPADRLSTARGYAAMRVHPGLRRVDIPSRGCLVINPTGMSVIGTPHGHTGIWGNETVMSNDSVGPPPGIWRAHFTHKAWDDYFRKKLGFPTFYFEVLGDYIPNEA